MKSGKITFYMLSFSFFAAILFQILLEIQNDLVDPSYRSDPGCSPTGLFVECYGFESKSNVDKTLALFYYVYTTLTTVGFGDFNPKSNSERIFVAFFMLFGVMIFSLILNNLMEVFDKLMKINEDYGRGNDLDLFIGILKQFNGGEEIPLAKRREYENYFDNRWLRDCNGIMQDPDNLDIVGNLAVDQLNTLYTEFLYPHFIRAYQSIFMMPKNNGILHARYTWVDKEYTTLIVTLCQHLEPVNFKRGEFLVNELDPFGAVIFPMKGRHCVGFTMNSKRIAVKSYERNVIGAYGATFKKRALFFYQTIDPVTAFFVRTSNWHMIMEDDNCGEIMDNFSQAVLTNYERKIKNQILKIKMESFKR